MTVALVIFLCWLAFVVTMVGGVLAAFNYDRVIAFVIDATDAPICVTAQMIAAMIHQRPDEWTIDADQHDILKHPCIGMVRTGDVDIVRVAGLQFGKWKPNAVERRIIWNAVVWRQRQYVQKLAHQQLRLNITSSAVGEKS